MHIPGLVTLIGSGEASPGMVKVHRRLMDDLGGAPLRPVFLETPAGFELGVGAIAGRFTDYFRDSLGVDLRRARYHHRDDPPEGQAAALAELAEANYIVAGPGSPTYAVDHLRETPIFSTIVSRWEAGAQIVFASAATVALGRHVLPVYEIYKVGQALHWHAGLDLLGGRGCELAIIPHWDNAEGGSHDTRACFMGMERFDRLRRKLPPTAVVLGIDEHTALTMDLNAREGRVLGRGGVTVLRGETEHRFPAGDSFPIDILASADRAAAPAPSAAAKPAIPSVAEAAIAIGSGNLAGGLRLAAPSVPGDLRLVLLQAASAVEGLHNGDEHLAPLIQVLVDLRSGLRERNEWALADYLRDRLAAIGIEMRDTAEGTIWVRTGQ